MDDRAALAKWQYRLLPWAIGMLLGLAVFFFASSWLQFDRLSASLVVVEADDIGQVLVSYEQATGAQDFDYLQWKTRILLERKVIERRYQQVNATLLLRAWTRHIGFLTGMILSFLGGIFILTKLSESGSQLSAEMPILKGSLATSSPGIVLTVVGGAIMIVSLMVDYRFSTNDTPAYISGNAVAPPLPEELPNLSDEELRLLEEAALFAKEEEEPQG